MSSQPEAERVPQIRANSEGVTFNRCQQAWWWAYREGLKPRGSVSDALWLGELVHIALATWYCGPGLKRGPHPAETFKSLTDDSVRYFKTKEPSEGELAEYTDLVDLGVAMLEGYVQLYGRDEKMLIIQPEKTFSFSVPFPKWWGEATRKVMANMVGTVDGVYRDAETSWLWVLENKTAKSIRTGHLTLDTQAGRYWVIIARSLANEGLVKPNEPLKGIMYNFLRKGLPDPRPRDEAGYCLNKDGNRSKVQPAALFKRHPVPRTRSARVNILTRMQNDAAMMEMYRTGELPLSKTPHWSCERFCDFFRMCELHEQGGNWEQYKEMMFKVVDPYTDHRKSTDEPWGFEF